MVHTKKNRRAGDAAAGQEIQSGRIGPAVNSQAANLTQVSPEDLVGEIHFAHERAERVFREGVQHAIRAGELLLQAKRTAAHGNWSSWLAENVEFSDRLAQAYMRLARLPLEKRNAVADLPLREALSAIRSRERRLADAAVREARISGPPRLIDNVDWASLPPPPPPPTPGEIADVLIDQLAQASYEVRDSTSKDDLRVAFERRFGLTAEQPATENDAGTSAEKRKAQYADEPSGDSAGVLAKFKAAAADFLPRLTPAELKAAREYVASDDWRQGAVPADLSIPDFLRRDLPASSAQ
jgi:hypothetical protein